MVVFRLPSMDAQDFITTEKSWLKFNLPAADKAVEIGGRVGKVTGKTCGSAVDGGRQGGGARGTGGPPGGEH